MSQIKPGMLCVVVMPKSEPLTTHSLIGRVVTAVRLKKDGEKFTNLAGKSYRSTSRGKPSWVITSNSVLPWTMFNGNIEYFHERTVIEEMLKPLIDPDHGVTEEEVRSLYSPSHQSSDDVITMKVSYQGSTWAYK